MASQYTLGNTALQYANSSVRTRYRMYLGVLNPIQFTSSSQDIQTDQFGQYVNISNVDLLAQHKAPFAPQPNFGPHRIGFVGEGLLFDGARSTQRGNLPASGHAWDATGSPDVVTYSHVYGGPGSQAMLTWSTPGIYEVSLTVKDRFGNSTTGKRQVVIYQDRDSTPQGIMKISGLSGSIDAGGWQGNITASISDNIFVQPDAMPTGSFQPVVIMVETYYETTPGNWLPLQVGPYGAPIPGQFYDDPRILFCGYVQHGAAEQDSQSDSVSFDITTINTILAQAGIHNLGYYNTTYNTFDSNGVPLTLKPSTVGIGQLVPDLTSEDIYRSLLLDHSNVALYHDVIIWRDFLPMPGFASWAPPASNTNSNTPSSVPKTYYLTYSHLSANEGSIWDACNLLAKNEFAEVFAERNGSICIGPNVNMRGYDLMTQPTDYGRIYLGEILNTTTELRNDANKSSQPAYLMHMFGPNPIPQAKDTPLDTDRDLTSLIGPPIAAHLSDVPVLDQGITAPDTPGLFTWIKDNWPQDLSVRAIASSFDEVYDSRAAFVKIVATLVNAQNVWSAWYPQNTFDATGLQIGSVPAGTWEVESDILVADATVAFDNTARQRSWQYLWEIARRRFAALNMFYIGHVTLGMVPWLRLHDNVHVTRQQAQTGPKLNATPFYITGITFQIDLDQQQWTTTVDVNQVTSYVLGPMVNPPFSVPTSN